MKTIFVTGTDTGVGKTWVSCLIIRQLRSLGLRVGAYKPVCSGASVDSQGKLRWDDVELLSRACDTDPPLDLVCPQRFAAAVAPNVAARLQGTPVDDRVLSTGIELWRSRADWLIVEGAGGLYCPLSDARSVLDLAMELSGPVVVVAANRLGAISHSRLTVGTLKSCGLSVAALVLNEVHAAQEAGPADVFTVDRVRTRLKSDLHIGRQEQSEQKLAVQAGAAARTNADQLRQWIPDVSLLHCGWQADALTVIAKPQHELTENEFLSLITNSPNSAHHPASDFK